MLLLFALANAGGVVAYAPLLTLLLPARILLVAGQSHVHWMGAAILFGALVASASNIGFGWLSDVIGTRRSWVAAGVGLTLSSYVLLALANSPKSIVLAVCLFQAVLNMLLAPLAAWTAESIPDHQKGRLGGLLVAGPLLGAGAGVIATLPGIPSLSMQLGTVCVIVAVLAAPLLFVHLPAGSGNRPREVEARRRTHARSDIALLWLSRFLVQVAWGTLFGFLLYYFQALPNGPTDWQVAQLSAVALAIAFPAAYAIGVFSDRLGRRKPFLILAAVVAATGLMVMAPARSVSASALGYLLFACGSTIYLALHSTYGMQLLPSPHRRGRDLGILNLSNTLPAIVAPVLAVSLVPAQGYASLLGLLAALLLLAALIIFFVRSDEVRGLRVYAGLSEQMHPPVKRRG